MARGRAALALAALTLAHFQVDMMGGVLPGFLPVAREHFGLSLGTGVLLLAVTGIGSNLFQLPFGLLRRRARRLLFVPAGVVLSLAVTGLALLPRSASPVLLVGLMLAVGIGIAAVHPEGLRGVLGVTGIAPGFSTPVFMLAGFLGFAAGPLVGAALVNRFGLPGLFWLLLPAGVVLLLLARGGVELAPERPADAASAAGASAPWSFVELFWIAVFLNTGSSIFQGLLPSYLQEQGLSPDFSGFSALLFGAGAGVGSLLYGGLSRRVRISRLIVTGLAAGLPVLALYFALSQWRAAGVLAALSGFCLSSSFPLIVVLAHSAPGRLAGGMRLAVMVGGSWGVASTLFLLVGQFGDRFGVAAALHLAWICYGLALATAALTRFRRRRREALGKNSRESLQNT